MPVKAGAITTVLLRAIWAGAFAEVAYGFLVTKAAAVKGLEAMSEDTGGRFIRPDTITKLLCGDLPADDAAINGGGMDEPHVA